ncbi:MAG TPA: DUF4259 domain-containing protein [Longimicrobium sp.]|jgi:hypothetical protein|uniref:DUF4259 domain-containing protein n=1 Tax=Longimicrobium sp. TaxID=2029185 RepID=UPI002ED7E16C
MGAWGAGSFDNDDAVDWLADLEHARDLTPIDAALAAVTGEGEPGESDASVAIAAAEVVAAIDGRPLADLPGEIVDWLASACPRPDPALTERSRAAVQRIRSSSGLKVLWGEGEPAEWYGHIEDLLRRLG